MAHVRELLVPALIALAGIALQAYAIFGVQNF